LCSKPIKNACFHFQYGVKAGINNFSQILPGSWPFTGSDSRDNKVTVFQRTNRTGRFGFSKDGFNSTCTDIRKVD
jgi:hypothetical protein